ncbi:hypothetical protein I3843_01G096900 [Carya illinoinensis]|nr:hypothetical protein I3843_01G096900 [Carya illinoinensis]
MEVYERTRRPHPPRKKRNELRALRPHEQRIHSPSNLNVRNLPLSAHYILHFNLISITNRKKGMWVPVLKNLTWAAIILGLSNAVVVLLGAFLVILAYPSCDHRYVFPFVAVSFAAGVRIVAMVPSGIAQEATAMTILESPSDNSAGVVDAVLRLERRMRYKKWLWWTRFATVITVLQFVGATYLMFHMAKYISHPGSSSNCVLGKMGPSNHLCLQVERCHLV